LNYKLLQYNTIKSDLSTYFQGRSEQSLWYGPKSKLAPLKKKFWTKNFFFRLWAKNCALVPLNGAPSLPFFRGGGVQTVVFWSNLRPCYYAITGRGPAGPPLATALLILHILLAGIKIFKKVFV
jgi:hypothetical protein